MLADDNARLRQASSKFTIPLLVFPALFVVLVLFGGGLIEGILQSMGGGITGAGKGLTLKHFSNVLLDPDFIESLLVTLYISVVSTIVASAISIAVALFLYSPSNKYVGLLTTFQIPLVVPHIVIAVSVMFLLAPSGFISRLAVQSGLIESSAEFPLLVNDKWGVGIIFVYIWKEVPFITLMLLSVLKNSGNELLDVAKTMNAGKYKRFFYVIMPLISPALGAASFIVFAFSFGAYEVPFLLGQSYPHALPVWAYRLYSDVDLVARPEGIAAGIIIAFIVILSVLFAGLIIRQARRRGVIL